MRPGNSCFTLNCKNRTDGGMYCSYCREKNMVFAYLTHDPSRRAKFYAVAGIFVLGVIVAYFIMN